MLEDLQRLFPPTQSERGTENSQEYCPPSILTEPANHVLFSPESNDVTVLLKILQIPYCNNLTSVSSASTHISILIPVVHRRKTFWDLSATHRQTSNTPNRCQSPNQSGSTYS